MNESNQNEMFTLHRRLSVASGVNFSHENRLLPDGTAENRICEVFIIRARHTHTHTHMNNSFSGGCYFRKKKKNYMHITPVYIYALESVGLAFYWNKMTVNFQEFPLTKRKNK